jgi:hypothetical protein
MSSLQSLRTTSIKGTALVLVLVFVVLLAGIVVAYLARTGTDRQVARGTFNEIKADQLARSGLDIVVGDLRQEITNGGSITAANIQAQRSGTPAPNTSPIANLIRRSASFDSIPAPGIACRASAINSFSDPSSNGRFVSLSRWNSHYLIPRATTATTVDSTPVSSFTAPDWIVVTSQGPQVITSPTTAALGRYAYAIYDEGGLLDLNVAGFPYSATSPATPGVTLADVGRKGVVAFADLTGLGTSPTVVTPATTPSTFLSATGINDIIGWRNYATVQPGGSFSSFTYDTAGASPGTGARFTALYLSNNNGFLTVPPTVFNGKTDQNLINRAELLELRSSISLSQSVLEYLGTFSREQNRPSWKGSTAIIAQRFDFGKLSIVKPNPAAAQNADILKYFGLKWVPGIPGSAPATPAKPGHWQYVGVSGGAMQSQIPAFISDPEFFQLLNYAMNNTNADDPAHILTTLSVGAALIDQYDDQIVADPTTGTTTTMIEYGGGWAFGLENTDPARPTGSPAPSPFPIPGGMSPTPPPAVSGYAMLNRPFRNVGEFGYAFRASATPSPTPAIPKTLDFVTATSPDAPILDLFTYNTARSRAGIVNLNTGNISVLTAIIMNAFVAETATTGVTRSNAIRAAVAIVSATSAQPALGRQDIPRLTAAVGTQLGATEEAKETIARALAETCQTRTWNLMIDLIAQSGRYPPNATTATDLPKFVVEGEKRYWLHIAIDRFTGQVIDQQLEAVYE